MTRCQVAARGAPWLALVVVAGALLWVTILGPSPRTVPPTGPPGPHPVQSLATVAVTAPAALTGALRDPSLVVLTTRGEPVRPRRLRAAPGVARTERIGLASVVLMGRSVTVAAVAPDTYARWTPAPTARNRPVWERVAAGDLAVTHDMATGLGIELDDTVPLGPGVRVGAIATTVGGVDAVVNRRRGDQLGIPRDNAVLVSVDAGTDVGTVLVSLEERLGRGHRVSAVGDPVPDSGVYAARLTGSPVAEAVGGFGYRWSADGTVAPDPSWVQANIRTEPVPLLGAVTCHRAMLPALRGVLAEVARAGLAASLDASDYGGCYVPRFIDRDPRRGLSLHTWGIAVDLNVTTNLPGTPGLLDPRVVALFERHGFSWGGRWRVPDPMHFELARVG